jgi:Uma2 family endonuclease
MEALKFENFEYYTYSDYKKWDDRWELIDGIPYAMAPAPYPIHQEVLSNFYYELRMNFCCKKRCKIYISPIDWKIDDSTIVQPDLAIFCEKSKRQFFSKTPPLVVEVLSKSTALKDVTTKYRLYERVGVEYYIMVEPNKSVADILKLVNGEYKLMKKVTSKDSYEFNLSNGCSSKIDFSAIFED